MDMLIHNRSPYMRSAASSIAASPMRRETIDEWQSRRGTLDQSVRGFDNLQYLLNERNSIAKKLE